MKTRLAWIIFVPIKAVALGFLAYKSVPGRYWPLCGLLVVSVAFIEMALIIRSRKGQNALIALYSSLLAFSAVEISSLILEPASPASLIQTPSDVFSDNPINGWAPVRPGIVHATKIDNETGRTIFDARYTINHDLLRKTLSADSGDTIAFFGDSWTFGVGVNDADTLPQSFSDLTGRRFRILNFGYSGYGPEQFLRMLETSSIDQIIKGQQKLFVFTTFAIQASRTACKEANGLRAPRYSLNSDGQVVFTGFCASGFKRAMLEFALHTGFYRRYFQSYDQRLNRQDIELYIGVLKRAVTLAEEKYGVRTAVIYDRIGDEYLKSSGLKDDDILAELRKGDIKVLDMDIKGRVNDGEPISFPHDGHPTPVAQRARAAVLKEYLDVNIPSVFADTTDNAKY